MSGLKKICFAIMLLLAMLLSACSGKHYDAGNISELYDRDWIIGRSREAIEEKYGDFHREFISDTGEDLGAFYVNYENKGIDPSYIHDTYFVVFDEAGIAVDAYFRETSIGG